MELIEMAQIAGSALAGTGLSAAAVIVGLTKFLGKNQIERIAREENKKNTEDIEKLKSELNNTREELKAELDKGKFRHEIQYKTEFEYYERAWRSLPEMEEKIVSKLYSGMPKSQFELNAEISPIVFEFSKLWNTPFTSKNVYDKFQKLIKAYEQSNISAMDLINPTEYTPVFTDEARANIHKSKEELKNAIKERVAEIKT